MLAAAAAAVQLHVSLQDRMRARPIEGYVWFVRLDDAPARPIRRGVRVVFGTTRGAHTIATFIRSCDGNCGYLDPPSHRCASRVRAPAAVVVRLTDAGCRILIRR